MRLRRRLADVPVAPVEADDDGLYVLKFRGAGQGPKALVAELVAGELAAPDAGGRRPRGRRGASTGEPSGLCAKACALYLRGP